MFEYDSAGAFTGMRAFEHWGIGTGKFFSASVCAGMWEDACGLSPDLVGELKAATIISDDQREPLRAEDAGGASMPGGGGRCGRRPRGRSAAN